MRDFHMTFTVAAHRSQAGRLRLWMWRIRLTSKEDRVTDNALITCLWFDTEGEVAATYYTSIFKPSWTLPHSKRRPWGSSTSAA